MIATVFLFLNMGTPELMLIFFVALLLFGGKKLPELARGLGKGIREFKDASDGIKTEIQNQIDNHKDLINEVTTDQPFATAEKPAEPQVSVPQAASEMPPLTYTAPLASVETIHQESTQPANTVAAISGEQAQTAAVDPFFISEEHQDDEKNARNSYYKQ